MGDELQKKKRRERFFRYAPLLFWIALVLFLSTGNASMSSTSRFVRPFLEFIFPNAPIETIDVYHAYIRKIAHLTEYAILAFWASRAFLQSHKDFLRKFWFIFAFGLIALIASIDETNQSYIASRTGSIYDVLLDIAGGTTMILIFSTVWKFFRRRKI